MKFVVVKNNDQEVKTVEACSFEEIIKSIFDVAKTPAKLVKELFFQKSGVLDMLGSERLKGIDVDTSVGSFDELGDANISISSKGDYWYSSYIRQSNFCQISFGSVLSYGEYCDDTTWHIYAVE